jgi:hypothetical protein
MKSQPDLFGSPQFEVIPSPAAERVVPFGKYKNQPFETLLTDAEYAMWLLSSMHAKLEQRHPALLAFLVARYGISDSTPEHNRLQNRFLDNDFAVRFALVANSKLRESASQLSAINLRADWRTYVLQEFERELGSITRSHGLGKTPPSETVLRQFKQKLEHCAHKMECGASGGALGETSWENPIQVYGLEFEKDGADVAFEVGWSYSLWITNPRPQGYGGQEEVRVSEQSGRHGRDSAFRVEVKPIVGDDYPAILRAMKAVKSRQLLVGEYCGAGASWDEVVNVFGLSGISVVLLTDVEQMPMPDVFRRAEVVGLSEKGALEIVEEAFVRALELVGSKNTVPVVDGEPQK